MTVEYGAITVADTAALAIVSQCPYGYTSRLLFCVADDCRTFRRFTVRASLDTDYDVSNGSSFASTCLGVIRYFSV